MFSLSTHEANDAGTIEQALEMWRSSYHISDEAYIQLYSILGLRQGANPSEYTGTMVFPHDGVGYATQDDYPDPADTSFIPYSVLEDLGITFLGTQQEADDTLSTETSSNPQHMSFLDNFGTAFANNDIAQQYHPVNTLQIGAHNPNMSNVAPVVQLGPQTRACIRCWKTKHKCSPSHVMGICIACSELSTPSHVCTPTRFVDLPIFDKWNDSSYQSKLAWKQLRWEGDSFTLFLGHEWGGPVFQAVVQEFCPLSPQDTTLYYKHGNGWNETQTAPWALTSGTLKTHEKRLDSYITEYTQFYLSSIGTKEEPTLVDQVLLQAKMHTREPLIQLSLKLWTANRLLMKGWQLRSNSTSPPGTATATDTESSLVSTIPAPRVLQNQLDRNIESYIAKVEKSLLRKLQSAMKLQEKTKWVVVFTAAVIFLHVGERDIWRLEHWIVHGDVLHKWRHPETPSSLIRRSLHQINVLLSHLRICGGIPPELSLTETTVKSARFSKPIQRYDWADERSFDFTLCRLAFDSSSANLENMAESSDFGAS